MSFGKNILTNSSFTTLVSGTPDNGVTDDFVDWVEASSGGKIEQVTDAYDSYAVKLEYVTGQVNITQRNTVSILLGEEYKFEYFGKNDGGTNDSTIRVYNWTAGANEFQVASGIKTTTYQRWERIHTFLADCSDMTFYIYQLSGVGVSYADKASIRKKLTTLYIDPAGDNANQGDTNLVPIKTLAEAQDRGFYNGSVFSLASGTYAESWVIGDNCNIAVPSGTATVNEIDFAGKTVTITGDLVVLNAINAGNVTGGTLLTSEVGFKKFSKFKGF